MRHFELLFSDLVMKNLLYYRKIDCFVRLFTFSKGQNLNDTDDLIRIFSSCRKIDPFFVHNFFIFFFFLFQKNLMCYGGKIGLRKLVKSCENLKWKLYKKPKMKATMEIQIPIQKSQIFNGASVEHYFILLQLLLLLVSAKAVFGPKLL